MSFEKKLALDAQYQIRAVRTREWLTLCVARIQCHSENISWLLAMESGPSGSKLGGLKLVRNQDREIIFSVY
jgi:hypothetical protein